MDTRANTAGTAPVVCRVAVARPPRSAVRHSSSRVCAEAERVDAHQAPASSTVL
ncbi:MAG TPA: hypothetical protein VGB24_16925 [Longimicrobium sp.]|uniref:hypothetical protein n=1 Tax=Longimicrobium sp. TaxID=2029185 RepID=UPI002ED8B5BC